MMENISTQKSSDGIQEMIAWESTDSPKPALGIEQTAARPLAFYNKKGLFHLSNDARMWNSPKYIKEPQPHFKLRLKDYWEQLIDLQVQGIYSAARNGCQQVGSTAATIAELPKKEQVKIVARGEKETLQAAKKKLEPRKQKQDAKKLLGQPEGLK